MEITVEEGIKELDSICAMIINYSGTAQCQSIPKPRPLGQELLKKAGITLPTAIPFKNVKVDTRKKLVPQRKTAKKA